MSCKWNGTGNPRIVAGRHGEECPSEAVSGDLRAEQCPGCLPCPEPHCRVCERAHADGACAECLAETRGDLHEIARLCDSLPEEVENRGVNGEAMMLLGPVADPEARGHLEASIAAGRVPADYLDHADGEQHPLFVLGSWDMVWRDALEHDEADALTLPGAVDYLDRQLAYMGGYEHVPFEDFARDLRGCRSHLEDVLRAGEQQDTGAPCMTCEVPLHLHRGETEDRDFWMCPRCKQRSTVAQYLFVVQNDYRKRATAMTARDISAEYDVSEGSVRGWASAKVGKVRKRGKDANGLQLYDVSDVLAARDAKKEPA